MFHIKRDGGNLCGNTYKGYKAYSSVPFSFAHKLNLNNPNVGCCEKCLKRYYEIISKMKILIIVK